MAQVDVTDSADNRRSLMDRVAGLLLGPEGSEPGHEVLKLLFFVWGMIFLGLLSLTAPMLSLILERQWSKALTVLAVGLFIAGAATACGSMLGFLFGVPKSNPDRESGDDGSVSNNEPPYVANTNFEKISDWLTKVIVGAGLVEARGVVEWLGETGQAAGVAMGSGPEMKVIATALIVHNLLMGFFQGFLVAYLYLPKAFSASRSSMRR